MRGQRPEGWRADQALTLPQAFAAFTTGAAYAGHAERMVGTLEPGKWADFILVDRNIFTAPPRHGWRGSACSSGRSGSPAVQGAS